ncbi:MAG: hypothetical protein OHK0046_46310 [Anaerolineae bacterium]
MKTTPSTLTTKAWQGVQPGDYPGYCTIPVQAGTPRAEAMRRARLGYGGRIVPKASANGVTVYHLPIRLLTHFHRHRRQVEAEARQAVNPLAAAYSVRYQQCGPAGCVSCYRVDLHATTSYYHITVSATSQTGYRDAYTTACRQARAARRGCTINCAVALPARPMPLEAIMASEIPGAPQFRRRYVAERILAEARDGKLGPFYHQHPRYQLARRVLADKRVYAQTIYEVW